MLGQSWVIELPTRRAARKLLRRPYEPEGDVRANHVHGAQVRVDILLIFCFVFVCNVLNLTVNGYLLSDALYDDCFISPFDGHNTPRICR